MSVKASVVTLGSPAVPLLEATVVRSTYCVAAKAIMNFSLTDDQRMIRDAAADFLAQTHDSAALRAAADSEAGFDSRLWTQIGAELGWCATAIPEAYGGLGLGQVELALLLEQMGRRQLCSPFFSSVVLAATALQVLGSVAALSQWLPPIASGELRATLGLDAHGVAVAEPGVRARREGQGWLLDGDLAHVPDGASAELLLVLARLDESELALFALPAGTPGLSCRPLQTWDQTRRLAHVGLKDVQLEAAARVDRGDLSLAALQDFEARAALLLAAEQLGGAQQCLDLTLAYTAERAQFGQKIAAFQAVKHRCAEMMVAIESTRSLVYGAAAQADSGAEPQAQYMEAGAAKALASETFFFCAQEAIQLHGGVGFTWEYDPQLYFKRAQAGSHWLGTPEQWRERIAAALLD